MPSLRALARLMEELEDQLVVCMRCGLCQAVCPLFAATRRSFPNLFAPQQKDG